MGLIGEICLENVNMQKYEKKLLAKISKTFPASKTNRQCIKEPMNYAKYDAMKVY